MPDRLAVLILSTRLPLSVVNSTLTDYLHTSMRICCDDVVRFANVAAVVVSQKKPLIMCVCVVYRNSGCNNIMALNEIYVNLLGVLSTFLLFIRFWCAADRYKTARCENGSCDVWPFPG